MSSTFGGSDFVDEDFQSVRATGPGGRPPTREELDGKVSETQNRLNELKAAQERLERERAALEEARRRQVELQTGRDEMAEHLARGIALLEEAEFASRRDAEQMARAISGLREAADKIRGINQEAWTKENWNVELSRALATIENARMEWNSARLKFPVLSGQGAAAGGAPAGAPAAVPAVQSFLETADFAQLCRLGFALTWPVLVGAGLVVAALLLRR